MKIIDLLNKIANGEEVPKEIKWRKVKFCYEYDENYEDYVNDLGFSLFRHDDEYTLTNMLNDEVEIIEEPKEHKIPEKLDQTLNRLNMNEDYYRYIMENRFKINEIIDYLEEIK